ncbi:hypothetical protein COY14_02320 [Candidatus Roizmanbacteria bacterium CG_4_10_14_0_2_um_filter_36_9]|uniref:Uncharacterized protein n=1 Tax=Candidatus Roizmanbacteria bacterium CG_4_10_14_0_2_um_filter_36_9 TaxID=1974823 RepID=A0A2M7U468_9BACT|nr:MAG: hypothetical protein COY14_02320 [Candidatus Roizmanbacteria bacterium CG_4_10_14_0_2_um_filter_36_9]
MQELNLPLFPPDIPTAIDIKTSNGNYDQVDYGEAFANTLRSFLLHKENSAFGNKLRRAMDDPELAHHGHHHSRHVEKAAEWALRMMLQKGKFDTCALGFQEDIVAFSLFHYLHDLDQQMTALCNVDSKKYLRDQDRTTSISEKRGHGIAAAVIALALAQDIADSTGISLDQARRIMSSSAIMMLRHDEPEQFDKTFNQDNSKGYTIENGKQIPLSGGELYNSFINDQLDVFTLSPSQLIYVLDRAKSKHHNAIPGSFYGLDPSFEEEHLEILHSLANDENPLFDTQDQSSQQTRERIVDLSEIAYWADISDMISPYTDQITRTLLTQYSLQRPLSAFSDSSRTVEESFQAVMGNEGGSLRGDDERIFWELVHAGSFRENSFIADDPEIYKFTREHVMLSAIAFKRFGEAIIQKQYAIINELYIARLNRYTEKYMKRWKHSPEENILIEHVFHKRVKQIIDEKNALLLHVSSVKPGCDISSREEMDTKLRKFQELSSMVIDMLKNKLGVDDAQMAKYEGTVSDFSPAETQFYTASDSLPIRGFKILESGQIIVSSRIE